MVIDTLIYDRTQADVNRVKTLRQKIMSNGLSGLTDDEKTEYLAGMKGAYNAVDLNRVGEAVAYLADLFKNAPTSVEAYRKSKGVADNDTFHFPYDASTISVTAKVDWSYADIPSQTQIEAYLMDVVMLRALLPLPNDAPNVPNTLDYFTYSDANDIEYLLKVIYDTLSVYVENIVAKIDNTAKSFRYAGMVYTGM